MMVILVMTLVTLGVIVLVSVINRLEQGAVRRPLNNRQVVMHELAELYAVENYVLLSKAVVVLERLLDDDEDLPTLTGSQRTDAQAVVREFHQRQLGRG